MYRSLLQLFALNSSATSRLLRNGLILFVLTIALLALSPTGQAVTPPPGGGYFNENTAFGTDALFYDYIGYDNTAIGFHALFSNNGVANTAVGAYALSNNLRGSEGDPFPSGNTAIGFKALFNNTFGDSNTANGAAILRTWKVATDFANVHTTNWEAGDGATFTGS